MQAKTNFFTDNADIDFHLSRRVPFDDLFAWLSKADRDAAGASTPEEYRSVAYEALSTLGAICGDEIAPNAARLEREPITLTDGEVVLPATLKSNLEKLLSFGTQAFGAGPAYGGLGFPILLQATGMELIIRACPSTGLNIVWYSSIAHIIEMFGNETLKDFPEFSIVDDIGGESTSETPSVDKLLKEKLQRDALAILQSKPTDLPKEAKPLSCSEAFPH